MGVPKFFRYISERYPCLSELVREKEIPEFDNLYLDMNGIIHTCSHPNDTDVHFRITEEQIFKDIFHYINTLFHMIEPKKLFFMAVDGVAPRAKMNQQRGRRFRSAKDAEMLLHHAKCKNEELPTTERFDSNCITPGTAFMARLNEALKHFIQYKISTNKLWSKCRVILSGHQTPGEGEHKIMEYIRYLKVQPDYDPNTRHCLYGLDADLIMLGLCTHEIHFALLREEVKFSKKAKRATCVDDTRFYLLHLRLLKEYLELEFIDLKENTEFEFDIERIVDDWILMLFLVGNDFIPHLPNLHIAANALPKLYKTYMDILPSLTGYINENGYLNLKRFEIFMQELAKLDFDLFREQGPDISANKNLETFGDNIVGDDLTSELDAIKNADLELEEFLKSNNEFDDSDEDYSSETEFRLHKRDYYMSKLKYDDMTEDVLKEQTECYIRAIQWTLSYYYHGVQSWGWFYPHHYAPYISDIKNFSDLKITFEMGKPFLPFEQLLAVLPAASKSFLPESYQKLMTDTASDIIDYYPLDFDTDLNGKKQDWEAVVLIPFIDEKKLLDAIKECNNSLTEEEKERNTHGPMFEFKYSETRLARILKKYSFNEFWLHCTETHITRDDIYVPINKLIIGILPNAKKDMHYPGFPTMKHLKYSRTFEHCRIKVFEQPSRNESIILKILSENYEGYDILEVGKMFLNNTVLVNWPHLLEAKVVKISNQKYFAISSDKYSDNAVKVFDQEVHLIKEHHMTRLGINFGDVHFLVHVRPIKGLSFVVQQNSTYSQNIELKKIFAPTEVIFPIQMVVLNYKKSDFTEKTISIESLFKKKNKVFMISSLHYGSMGDVVDTSMYPKCGRIRVNLNVLHQPDFTPIIKKHSTTKMYKNSYESGATIGISSSLFSRITGTILVVSGMKRNNLPENTPKTNIGLQLKFPKNNEEIPGYTKKIGKLNWYYSDLAINVVKEYTEKYPQIFKILATSNRMKDMYFEEEFFPEITEENCIQAVSKWIKGQAYQKIDKRDCGSETVEKSSVEEIIETVNEYRKNCLQKNIVTLQVKAHFLFNPLSINKPYDPPDPNAIINLFDRVIICNPSHVVPLGSQGTVIGVYEHIDQNPVRQQLVGHVAKFYDVLFDEAFECGGSIHGLADGCVYRVSHNSLISITYGQEKANRETTKEITQKENVWKRNHNTLLPKKDDEENRKENVLQLQILKKPNPSKNEEILNKETIDSDSVNPKNDFKGIWEELKSGNEIKLPSPPKPLPKVEKPKSPPSSTKTESNDGTDVLKKMLGLSMNSEQRQENNFKPPQPPQPPKVMNTNFGETQKFTVDQFFEKVSKFNVMPNLPNPPPNWTKESFPPCPAPPPPFPNELTNMYFQNQRPLHGNEQMQLSDLDRMKSQNLCYNSSSQSFCFRPQAIPCSPEKMQNINWNKRNAKPSCPKGPQNLSNNTAYPAGHGAFIPLQAMRNKKKIQNNESNEQQQQQQTTSSSSIAIGINNKKGSIEPVQNTNISEITKEQVKLKESTVPESLPIKARTSRIAAKFSGMKS